jgi:hypothetical protein
MTKHRKLQILVILAALVGLARTTTPTQAANTTSRRILRGSLTRNTEVTGSDNRKPRNSPLQENNMNKKQLAQLVAAIVAATRIHADSVMETTEDEARTLVGMALRRSASQIVQDASGADEETARELLAEAQTELAAIAAAKKAAKKTATAGVASDDEDGYEG